MWGEGWFDRNAYTNNVLTTNFVLSFFPLRGAYIWFSFIAYPQKLQMIDIEDLSPKVPKGNYWLLAKSLWKNIGAVVNKTHLGQADWQGSGSQKNRYPGPGTRGTKEGLSTIGRFRPKCYICAIY